MRVRGYTWLLLLTAAGLGFFLWQQVQLLPDGRLHVYFLDIGQGDSTLIVTPSGKQILIDGGPDNGAVSAIARHMPFLDRSLDMLVLSHPHLDHVASFPSVLRRYQVGSFLYTDTPHTLSTYQETLSLLQRKGVRKIVADPTKDMDLGDGVILDIVWPPPLTPAQKKDLNNTSVVLRVRYGTGAILFTGDMEKPEEEALLRSRQDIRAGILKVAHHGSKTSSTLPFIQAVQPRLAVISAGKNNRYRHPTPEVVERYKSLGIAVKVTADVGEVDVVW